MPLPILIGIAAATAAVGVGKGVKAVKDNNKADDINYKAKRTISRAKDSLEVSRKDCNTALESLGSVKLSVLDKSISRFISSFEKLKNVQLQESAGLDEMNKFRLDKQSVSELREMSGYASSILGGVAGGTMAGALAGFGAYGATMTFASASTGTAIAALSGAAAKSATLAFLGGGSLAAGGLGVAGGAMVLGGLVAGPALAVMGFVIGAKASANLDNARSNLAEARVVAEELETAAVLCDGIRNRCEMFESLLVRLDSLFIQFISSMEGIIAAKGNGWNAFDSEEKKAIAACASIAGAVKKVLDTPILAEDGKLTEESAVVASEIEGVVDAYGSA